MNHSPRQILTLLMACLFMLSGKVSAQSRGAMTWEEFVEDYMQYMADDEEGYGATTMLDFSWLEEYEALHRQPLDINEASREELAVLRFLSDVQLDSLVARRTRYGGFRSLGELMTVRELSYRERAWMSVMVKFGATTRQKADDASDSAGVRAVRALEAGQARRPDFVGGQWEVAATMDVPLYRKDGFRLRDSLEAKATTVTDKDYMNRMFLGENFAHTLRLRYKWEGRLMYGATVQQDVGERFGAYGAKPWDYESAYFYYKSVPRRTGRGTWSRYTLTAGDYKLSVGQGLVMGASGWNVRAGAMGGLREESLRLRPNTGTDETRFLRGVAGEVRLGARGQWSVATWASCRALDGTVKGANQDNYADRWATDTITAWKTDGLHRTGGEVAKRGVAHEWLEGVRVAYMGGGSDSAAKGRGTGIRWNVGVNGVGVQYDRVYWPAERLYNRYYMRGRDTAAASCDYTIAGKSWSVQGEAAMDIGRGWATTCTARWSPLRALRLVAQERSMSVDFVAPHGHTLQANSQLQNEHGGMFGIDYSGFRRLELSGFVDYGLLPAPAYLADTTSHRLKLQGQAVWRASRMWRHTLRYSVSARTQNVTGYKDIKGLTEPLLSWRSTHHVRWQTSWTGELLTVVGGADGSCYYSQGSSYDKKTEAITGGGHEWGGLVFVRASVNGRKNWRANGTLAGFATEDYNARCYAYMPQLAGRVSVPSFYGRGFAAVGVGEYKLGYGLVLSARFSIVRYWGREQIGSGLDMVAKPYKSDMSFGVRWVRGEVRNKK